MSKLRMVIVSDEQLSTLSMAGCGKNISALCGTKECSFTPGKSH